MTKPSRSLSNGREACLGSSLRVLMAFMAQKPPMPIGTMVASAPPASMTLASPILIVRQASPMAWLAVAQAEQVAKFGPAQVEIHRDQARGHVRDEHRDHERREPARAALEQDRVLLGDGLQAADAGADEDADFVAVDLVQVQPGILERLPGGINAELGIAVRAPDFLGRGKGRGGVEVLHLAGDLGVECRGVERGDRVDAALARERLFQKVSTSLPRGETTPRPVITTRRSVQLLAIKSNGAAQADASPSCPGNRST